MSEHNQPFQITIAIEEDSLTAIEHLAKNTELSKEKLKQTMHKGAVWLTRNNSTQRLRRAKKILQPGDTLHFYYDKKVLEEKSLDARLLADQGQYSVWYKPYGMRSQGSRWGDHTTIYRYAEQNLKPQRTAFIVHRLDRFASGLIILAHSKTIANAFARMFENRQIEKHYQAIVTGRFPAGTQHFTQAIDDKAASSYASLLGYDEKQDRSLVEIKIETGRKHQIRRHLATAGYPIIGDRLYGDAGIDSENLQLTCCYLAFTSPTDGSEQFYSLPEELLLRL
ncbi:MAG: RNA pseudouridine synthase [Gammaproteobacteria bacterium]|jgi:tRNA pseudouridine32 synthase/23S rRNA pseudouridine746 synthase